MKPGISRTGRAFKTTGLQERTHESLRLAKRTGFQSVEFDVRFKDGKAVVIHDETINRTLRDLQETSLKSRSMSETSLLTSFARTMWYIPKTPKQKPLFPRLKNTFGHANLYKVILL